MITNYRFAPIPRSTCQLLWCGAVALSRSGSSASGPKEPSLQSQNRYHSDVLYSDGLGDPVQAGLVKAYNGSRRKHPHNGFLRLWYRGSSVKKKGLDLNYYGEIVPTARKTKLRSWPQNPGNQWQQVWEIAEDCPEGRAPPPPCNSDVAMMIVKRGGHGRGNWEHRPFGSAATQHADWR